MENRTEILNKIERYLPMKIGTNLFVNRIIENKGTNKIDVSIGISVPRIIYDDELQKQFIKFIRFDDLYKIDFDITKEGDVLTSIKLNAIYDKFRQREQRLIYNVESIILDEIYPNLIEISLIRNNLKMIYVVLASIIAKKIFTQKEINKFPKRERLEKYVSFLEEYGIIRKNSSGDYIEGNIPIELHKAIKNKDETEVLRHTFGYALKSGRKYLKDELNLHFLDTYIAMVTTYYYLSARVGKLIQVTNETFFSEFMEMYSKNINSSKFFGYLTELNSALILNKKGSMYFGDKGILDKIMDLF
jgi:hypothetical protein